MPKIVEKLPPIHPGEVLLEEFLRPLGLSVYAAAKALNVPNTRIDQIVKGRRGITGDTALRLARAFGTTPEFWMGMQAEYDLRVAAAASGDEIARSVTPVAA